ncbi:Alpha/Beta hydrolase protein [Schizophyllum amplum]|uniref:Alpha/Beta hydrolase protein n=1 Tax=Schizophyllum amplum TaxID=97359 RepID=A0A550C8P3_9AGAR|nr:Alpha/Beta hydrolase protein [Auriculariopsis ampla]
MNISLGPFLVQVLGGAAVTYATAVLLLSVPYIQGLVLYLNKIKLPLFAKFDLPEKYGLAPNKTLNFRLRTPDGEELGAWFVLADPYYRASPHISSERNWEDEIGKALAAYPTILFFHGNAATRAFPARIQHYTMFSSRLAANVLAIDYRGFGDSTGTPSEEGLTTDAHAAWRWLVERGARPQDIVCTGVTARLGVVLEREGEKPRGLVLMSPFSSISEVVKTYSILGLIPLMRPLHLIPGAVDLVGRMVVHRFDTLRAVRDLTSADVVVAHSENDYDIPYTHSEALFEAFLEPLLPAIRSAVARDAHDPGAQGPLRREDIVKITPIHNFGTVEEFVDSRGGGRKVTFVKALAGGHDYLGVQEGLQDVLARTFDLGHGL